MSDLFANDDLLSRARLDEGHSKPAKLAVIGNPVAHSASPRMHQPALDEAGIGARYIKVEVPVGTVRETFRRMREAGFIGCNVTVPHKFEALEACDEVEAGAAEMGVVNTVRFDPDATRGFNTDGPGFEAAVRETLGLGLEGTPIAIVGAGGGAGGALAVHCARAGVSRLVLANRTVSKIEALARSIRESHPVDVVCMALDDPALPAVARECQLLVNTSSLGLKEGDASPLDSSSFRPGQAVYDTIYQPPRTAFLRSAESAGARVANGAAMLLHQGVHAFKIWFPGTDPIEAMRRGLGS